MNGDLVYVVHPEAEIATKVSAALLSAEYKVLSMSTEAEAEDVLNGHQFVLPDAILTPLGDLEGGDSILIKLYGSNPLMEQIPLVVLASEETDQRRKALRMGLLSVIFPPYDEEEVALTTQLAIEKHKRESLLFGSLSQLSVPDLLQTAEVGRRSGTIEFRHADYKGKIWFLEGRVVDAQLDGVGDPEDALYSLVLWERGTFEANFRPIEVKQRFNILPSELLLEAMRRLDEGSLPFIDFSTPRLDSTEDPRGAVLDISLTLLNSITSYALNHIEPGLLSQRCESLRQELLGSHGCLEHFKVGEDGLIAYDGTPESIDAREHTQGSAALASRLLSNLGEALAWRFSPARLAQLMEPWYDQLRMLGFLEPLGLAGIDPAPRDEERSDVPTSEQPIPTGCFIISNDGKIERFSAYGTTQASELSGIIGRQLLDTLPSSTRARLEDMLRGFQSSTVGASEAITVEYGHDLHQARLRVGLVRAAGKRRIIATITRLRPADRPFSAQVERDVSSGTISDGATMRLLLANDDFLAAFDSLFTRGLKHHRHEILHRLGKEWGLRHALRMEWIVQRDYGLTLREAESQVALELFTSSLGVLGLGRFAVDLSHRDRGLIIVTHHRSPFTDRFTRSSDGGSCAILAGFHAALMSYLAGRQLAAREVFCGLEPDHPCRFIVATEKRLSKLLVAAPETLDHTLLTELREPPKPRNPF